ncbi:MAG: hypothetical protein WBC51_21100 [Vicinamibacterales bacterium]
MARIFYYCYDHQVPRGGQKETYRHVQVLTEHGLEAYALHNAEGTRLTWFPNAVPVVSARRFTAIFDPASDVIVLPEDLGWRINEYPGRKVIFNKGVSGGFCAFGTSRSGRYPYVRQDVLCAFVMSEHNRRQLQLAFPQLAVYRMFSEVDPATFRFKPLQQKRPLIAVVQKSSPATMVVYHTLRARAMQRLNRGDDFEWQFLGRLDERTLASTLADALVIIFSTAAEGGPPRTLLEAMASGCLIAPLCIEPMRESIPEYAWFDAEDVQGVVSFVEEIMGRFPHQLERYEHHVEAGRRIAAMFSIERQAAAVLDAWTAILAQLPSPQPKCPVAHDAVRQR